MRTAEHRFYKSDTQFRGADSRVRPAAVYSYESHKALYDVLEIEGLRFVRVNMGPLSNLICDWRRHHYAIEHHFGL